MMSLFSRTTEIEAFLFARSLPVGIWVLIVMGVIITTVLLYRRERGLRLGLRLGLMSLRIALLLLVIAALFEPTVAVNETHETKRALAVLIDKSQSMGIRDQRKRPEDVEDAAVALGFLPFVSTDQTVSDLNTNQRNAIAAASRIDLVRRLLSASAAPLFEALSEDLDIRYYTFGDTLDVLGDGESTPLEAITAIQPEAVGTSIADAMQEVASATRGASLSGLVILSDGIETGSRHPEAVAHDLGIMGLPVYTVPIGILEPDDVSIRNVIVQDVAFAGDTVPVRVQIRSQGYEKRKTDVVVMFDEKEVAREGIVLEHGVQFIELAFDAQVNTKGAVVLDVRVEPFMDEATAENNRVVKSVRVVNEKINVLCIEGSARWEFRYLRAILKRDPRINATFIATRTGNDLAMHSSDYIARFPEDAADAFKYDLVILGDVDASFFTVGEFARLEQLVRERGGSLLMLAGPSYAPTSYEGTPVETMLPVTFNARDKWQDIGKSVYPVLTAEGRSSLVLTLDMNREKNDRLWTHVAPMDRLPPLLEPRPGATVLATLSDAGSRVSPYPLISWQRYGTGKCMLLASDRLWRLRFRTGDRYHWRVWSQCIQFLTLSRLMGEHKQIRMETDRVSYPEGEQVRIYAEVLDDGYEPVMQPRYDVFVGAVSEDDEDRVGSRISLRPDAARPGLYVGFYTPPGKGRYRIQASEEDLEVANVIEFQVADISAELSRIDMQLERLQRIAEQSGGTCLRLADIDQLPGMLDRSRLLKTIRTEQSVWDNWLFALLLIALAGCEWIVRRRHDLL